MPSTTPLLPYPPVPLVTAIHRSPFTVHRLLSTALLLALLLAGCASPGPLPGRPSRPLDTAPPPATSSPGAAGEPAQETGAPAAQVPLPVASSPAASSPAPSLPPTASSTASPSPSPTASPAPSPTPDLSIHFAVIGDYGAGGQPAADVAALVKSWEVDFILTTGDNNYPYGEESTLDKNVGQFYSEFIAPYRGIYGPGGGGSPEENRFFPALGNHDWMAENAGPYLDYFTLPGNERYYEFTRGAVHFFALDSDSNEPDGVGRSSRQAQWLQERLAASTLPWQIVYMHQPPYSSGVHGPIDWAQWPYAAWGADAVLGGHDHTYERLLVDGIPYFINGLGGGDIYYFEVIDPNSQARFAGDWGAMLVEADPAQVTFQFVTRSGQLIDAYTISH